MSGTAFSGVVYIAETIVEKSQSPEIDSSSFFQKGTDIDMQSKMIRNVHPGKLGTDAVNKGQVYLLIKDRIYLKKGKLNHRVHIEQGSRYISLIVRFDKLFRDIDEPIEKNTPVASRDGRVPSVTNIYSNRFVIPLSFFITKNHQSISLQANVSHLAWFLEPKVFAEDAFYYYDLTGTCANADYMFYFIMFRGASIVEA